MELTFNKQAVEFKMLKKVGIIIIGVISQTYRKVVFNVM